VCDCFSWFHEVSERLAGCSVAEVLTELDACGYVVGSEGKLTNASSPFLPRILMVRLVDGDGSGLSDAAFTLAAVGGGVGRPADMDAFKLPLELRLDRVDSATGGAGALTVASWESGSTGLYGLLRNGGTKNGFGVFASDGADDLLTRSLSRSAGGGGDLAAVIAAARLSSKVACISLFASPSSMCSPRPVP
jgi:hypothetical protein